MTIIWCMVPEIWSTTDKLFYHFGLFFALLPPWRLWKSKFWKNEKWPWRYYHFTHVYHKWQSYDVWFQRYVARRTEVFLILDHFLPFYPPNNSKNQNFEKTKKKNTWRYYHLTHVYHKWQSYDVWFLRYGARRTKFFIILDCFLPFCPPDDSENQNFEKMKNDPGDIIILHMCTINDNHMMYGSWDMEHDEQNFLSFWTVFLPLYAPNDSENQNFEKMKKRLEILLFYTCAP